MATHAPDLAAALAVLEEMTQTDTQWRHTLAGFTGADGDIDTEKQTDYDTAKLDHGWDLVDDLPGWIARLAAALGPAAGPR